MKKVIVSILLAVLFLAGCGQEAGYVQITAQEAKQIMDSGEDCLILDVRTQEVYAESHIPEAVVIPHDQIRDRASADLPGKDRLILVYCRSGRRSKEAAETLAALGYTNVKEFGGINDWPYGVT